MKWISQRTSPLLRSRLGLFTTNDPRGRQAPLHVSRCGRKTVRVRTLRLRSQDGTIGFCQLRRGQHHGNKEERSAQLAGRYHHPIRTFEEQLNYSVRPSTVYGKASCR